MTVGSLLYKNTLHAPFTFDDIPNIVENPYIRMTAITPDQIAKIFDSPSPRPVANFTFAVNYYLHQLDPAGYHIVNILIHLFTAVLVFLLSRQTLRLCHTENSLLALFAALLWLSHPLHTQSVTYIVQRMTALSTMFYLLSLLCYITARTTPTGAPAQLKNTTGLLIASVLFGLLGLATKPIVAPLPLFILLFEWFFIQDLDAAWLRKQTKWIVTAIGICLILALIYLGETPVEKILSGYAKRNFTLGERLLTEPRVVIFYISLLFFPHPSRLTLDYDFPLSQGFLAPETTILSIAALFLLFVGAIVAARKHRLVSFAIIWFLGNLVLESSFIGLELIFEHRTYLPSIFLTIAFTWLFLHYIKPVILARLLIIGIICICGLWTIQRNTAWGNAISLWKDGVAKSPQKFRPYNNLGLAYRAAKNQDAALTAFQKSLSLNPGDDLVLHNIGLTFQDKGDLSNALRYFQKALESNPANYEAYHNVGKVMFDMGKWEKARQMYEKVLAIYPLHANAHNGIGIIYLKQGKSEPALAQFQRTIEIDPYFEKAYNNMGIVYFQNGDINKAIDRFHQSLKVNPDYLDARNNLQKVEKTAAQYGPSIDWLIQACNKNPDNPALFYQLGQLYQTTGMVDAAIRQYQKALHLRPDWAVCLNTLGNLYAVLRRDKSAINTFEALARILPDTPNVFYNLACLYARKNQKDTAILKLKLAIENGYVNWDHLKTDTDLANIRDTKYYAALMTQIPITQ